jgi:hypothetical protein
LRLDRSARGVDDGHRDRDRDTDDDESQQQVLNGAEATRGCVNCRRMTAASWTGAGASSSLLLDVALSTTIGRRSGGRSGVSPTRTMAPTNFNGRIPCITCR